MKKLTLPTLFLISFSLISTTNASSSESPKDIVKNCFRDIIQAEKWDKPTYDKYFSEDYVQIADGKTLNYTQSQEHVKTLKRDYKSIKIVFHEIVTENNKVATRHTGHVIKNDNSQIEVDVMAIFEIKDGKIIACRELTRLVKGNKADEDIGSRY
ncbi:MAG: nuclear transport factor 2 family protein [Alphaproteobacteria bacterium]|nr:nuclear transport factor 2 family protein [Alphaproteobacteria bacterium]